MLANLPRCTMSLDAETAELLHHVVVMFRRRIADAEDPVKQIGVGAIEQRLESPELVAVQRLEGVLGERAENEVAFLRPAMPAPKQEAPAADIRVFVICGLGKEVFHLYSRCHCEPLLRADGICAANGKNGGARALAIEQTVKACCAVGVGIVRTRRRCRCAKRTGCFRDNPGSSELRH